MLLTVMTFFHCRCVSSDISSFLIYRIAVIRFKTVDIYCITFIGQKILNEIKKMVYSIKLTVDYIIFYIL